MTKRAIITRYSATANGVVTVRVEKQTLGGEMQPHIVSFPPDRAIEHIKAENDAHLVRQGFGAVENWEALDEVFAAVHTEEAAEAYAAERLANQQVP